MTLSDCIRFAYGLVSNDQIAGADWIRSQAVLFDIVAEAPAGTPREQILLMTQALLAERLKLAVHREAKVVRHLDLAIGNSGPRMQPASDDPAEARNNSGGSGRITGNRVSMQLLASLLSRLEHEIVIDRTGLSGEFQVKLEWLPGSASPAAAVEDRGDGVSVFTAVEQQLGLRLEAGKSPIEIVVVDRAEKVPAEN